MKQQELLVELESLVDAIAQTLSIISGTLAATHGAAPVLRYMLAAKDATETYYGPNAWRDRLIREMVRIVAMRARPAAPDDPELQALIESVFAAPVGKFQKN